MQITVISQCEKGALARTRRILDAFAERIGDSTWQTIITQEGLDALHIELRKTASKSTAIACHWQRSRTRSQLLWVVGKRHSFNSSGNVPVNLTENETQQFMDKGKWKYLEVMKVAVGIAGLFHDFGKANDLFQAKLTGKKGVTLSEPFRHEWISLLLFDKLVNSYSDKEWLDRLEIISEHTDEELFTISLDYTPNLSNYPPLAELIGWLILSHHKLPVAPESSDLEIKHIDGWLKKNLTASWNSPQCLKDKDAERLIKVQTFSFGLPSKSPKWRKHAMEFADRARKVVEQLPDSKHSFLHKRHFAHLSRLTLMLSDHFYSQGESKPEYQSDHYQAIANTDKKWKQPKQQLDEHNIGVALNAQEILERLPSFQASLTNLEVPKESILSKKVSKAGKDYENFGWQNNVLKVAKKIRKETSEMGFFGINIASTGKGKTIANAKIMHALGSSRFNVALGLRTLTLQTGISFQKDLGLDESQLATLVGGIAVKELYALKESEGSQSYTGSESQNEVTDFTIHSKGILTPIHSLSEWTKHDEQIEKLLAAPILVSTIDHLIPATEGIRGGKQIGPMLRLLTSDLILDEPDDFGLEDLPALSRLVNWAGMLGRRVLLSSATMPPSLVNALFHSYKQGREDYLQVNSHLTGEPNIACAWFDEYDSQYRIIRTKKEFAINHSNFTDARIKALKLENGIKKGALLPINLEDATTAPEVAEQLATTFHTSLLSLHETHAIKKGEKRLSVGLIRMANIDPLVAVAQSLTQQPATENTAIHYVVYHSRYPLAIRSHLENHLDTILSRKDEAAIWDHPQIAEKLADYPDAENHIFVVLSSPVAEVGRDHDYDWAIAEPSSLRSIIQLAGRVLRHRPWKSVKKPNILILQHNFKGLRGRSPCFTKPGFESSKLRASSSDLADILPPEAYEVINSCARIRSGAHVTESGEKTLISIEHEATLKTLIECTPATPECIASKWWEKQPTWNANLQLLQRFRASAPAERYCLLMDHEEDEPTWYKVDPSAINPARKYSKTSDISPLALTPEQEQQFWFDLSASTIMKELHHKLPSPKPSYELMTKQYAESSLINYSNDNTPDWKYHPQLGTFKEI